jgi:hypothetical protein
MSNIKKRDFYDVITGDPVMSKNYGYDSSIYKRSDNADMIFDSEGRISGDSNMSWQNH